MYCNRSGERHGPDGSVSQESGPLIKIHCFLCIGCSEWGLNHLYNVKSDQTGWHAGLSLEVMSRPVAVAVGIYWVSSHSTFICTFQCFIACLPWLTLPKSPRRSFRDESTCQVLVSTTCRFLSWILASYMQHFVLLLSAKQCAKQPCSYTFWVLEMPSPWLNRI